MANRIKKDNGSFKAKSISIGIDVHKLSWRVTAVSDGEVIMAVTLSRPTYEGFKKLLAPFKDSTVKVVYEAGPGGFGLYDRLTEDGFECIVTPPSLIPTDSGNRVKTDKKDSLKLARLLDSNMLKKVWVLSPAQALNDDFADRVRCRVSPLHLTHLGPKMDAAAEFVLETLLPVLNGASLSEVLRELIRRQANPLL